jgi:Transglutaminase-like superfamily
MARKRSSIIKKGFALLCFLAVMWLRDTRGRFHEHPLPVKPLPVQSVPVLPLPVPPLPVRVAQEAPPPIDETAIARAITSETQVPYRPMRGALESSRTGTRWSLKEVQQVYADDPKGHYYTFTEWDRVIAEVGFGRDGSFYPVPSFLVPEKFPDISNVWMPQFFTARSISYRSDTDNFKYSDVWQLPAELVRQGSGDCEDHAVLIVDWLLEKGFDARVVDGYMDSVNEGNGHAWAVVFNPDIKDFVVIEATSKRFLKSYPLAKSAQTLIPHYMWNRSTFWENTGFPKNFDYSSSLWVKRSVFHPKH